MATTMKPVVDTETGEVIGDIIEESFLPDEPDMTDEQVAEIEEELVTDPGVAKASHNVGMRLLSAFIDELTAAGVRRNDETELVLERLTRRIKSELRRGYLEIMARDVPTVITTMGKVVFGGDKIQATITIDKHIDDKNRHALADFAGSDVLIVMADDVEEHLADMDALAEEASSIQTELDLSEPTLHERVVNAGVAAIRESENQAITEMGEAVNMAPDEAPATMQELIVTANALALKLGENDVPDVTDKWDRDHLLDYIVWAEGKLAPAIDPSRLIVEDGKTVAIAPDPDCEDCGGKGGWDEETDTDAGAEWVRCGCVELPK